MSEHAPDVRIEDLLAHAGWVRRLAVSLVRDPGAADDLVQETWLAAMRKPPRGDRPVRGWLAGVVRNLARQRRRGEGRRARREAVVGTHRKPLASTAELAERMETQRDLAEAVLALAEPWRSTVILRYLEGLSSAEIARRQGVPAATVRGRLKRGIEELRTKLDDRHGGKRRAWVAALAPFLPKPPTVPAAPGAAAALVSGVFTMSLTAKLLFGTAVLLAVFGALAATDSLPFFSNDDQATDAIESTSIIESERSATEGPKLETARRGRKSSSTVPVEATPATASVGPYVEARIVDGDGRGIPGATLRLTARGDVRAEADEHGRVELAVDKQDTARTCDLIAHARGHVLREMQVDVAPLGATTIGEIALAPGGTVRGRVVDHDGRPLSDVQVQANGPDLAPFERERGPVSGPLGRPHPVPTVAEDGRFELPGLPVGFVRIWASGRHMRYAYSEPVEVYADRVTEGVVLKLEPLRPEDAIRGVVLHPGGKPALGAEVRYVYRHGDSTTSGGLVTDAAGRFELRMGAGGTASLRVKTDDGYIAPTRFDVAPSAEVVELTLQKSRVLRVVVKTAGGESLDSVTIMTKSTKDPRVISWHTEGLSKDGVAELPAPNEAYRVSVHAGGYRSARFGPFQAGEAPAKLEAVMELLPTLRGRVTANGKPVVKARVLLHAPALPNERIQHNGFDVRVDPHPKTQTQTDEDGRYALGVEESGTFVLRVDAEGFAAAEKEGVRVDAERGDEGLDFVLGAGGTIRGRVTAAGGRSPVGMIVGVSRGDGYAITTRAGAGGTYRFDHLMPGPYEVRVVEEEISPNRASTSQTGNVKPPAIEWSCRVRTGEVTEHDIDLRVEAANSAVLAGAIEVDGAPPKGWVFKLMTEPGDTGMPITVDRGTLDGKGRFRATAKKPGAYRVMISSEGQAQGRRGFFVPLMLDRGETQWSIAVRTGTIEGVIASGAPAQDVKIFLVWQVPGGGLGLTQIQPDAQGSFRLDGVFAGKTLVVRMDRKTMASLPPKDAMNPENWPVVAEVDVKAGVVTTMTIP